MERISIEKSEIIGLLCAEGSYHNYFSTFKQYYPERKKYYLIKNKNTKYIQFSNYDKNLLIHFKKLIKNVYNYNVNLYWDRVRICKREIIKDLLRYTDYGHLKWIIPNEILNSNKMVKIGFLRGFFDGDGTISNTVRIFSTNEISLRKVCKLLDDIKIKNTFNGPYYKKNRKPYFYIYIKRIDENRFLKLINPISKKR